MDRYLPSPHGSRHSARVRRTDKGDPQRLERLAAKADEIRRMLAPDKPRKKHHAA